MDQQGVLEFIGKLSYVIAVTGLVIVIALIWYKITGHSPTLQDLILGLQIATLTLLVGFIYHSGKFQGKVEQFIEENSGLKERITKLEMGIGSVKQTWK